MIERDGSDYYICCDLCPHTDGPFTDFWEAKECKLASKEWVSVKVAGEWEDHCRDCHNKHNDLNVIDTGKVIKIDFGG